MKIDDIDKKMLNILQKEGRVSNLDLSKRVGISASPCLRRLRFMIDRKIIKGFFAKVDIKLFNKKVFLVSINIENSNNAEEFEKYVESIECFKEIYKLATEKDYLIKMLASDIYECKSILKSSFSEKSKIKKISVLPVLDTLKEDPSISIL